MRARGYKGNISKNVDLVSLLCLVGLGSHSYWTEASLYKWALQDLTYTAQW